MNKYLAELLNPNRLTDKVANVYVESVIERPDSRLLNSVFEVEFELRRIFGDFKRYDLSVSTIKALTLCRSLYRQKEMIDHMNRIDEELFDFMDDVKRYNILKKSK